jgi:hypothetical protein
MKITVEVQNDAGEVVAKYTSHNCVPANTVTVYIGGARWMCVDDASNTYIRELEQQKPRKNLDKTVREN